MTQPIGISGHEPPAIKVSIQRMVCTGCGAEANASCNCGEPYVPKSVRAAEAIAANPEKSDRAIAAEIGVDHKTVGKARKATGDNSPVEKRTGLDGKRRRKPNVPSDKPEPHPQSFSDLLSEAHAAMNGVVSVMRRMTDPQRIQFREQAQSRWSDGNLDSGTDEHFF